MTPESNKILNSIFRKVLNVSENTDLNTLSYQNTTNWDSLRHVDLMIKISKYFKIQFNTEEILSLKSYEAIKKCLEKKLNIYGI